MSENGGDVLIPFGDGLLALTREQFEEARRRGRELRQPQANTPPAEKAEILDAAGMEGRTRIPASWWLEQARRNAIPHLRAGKYVRFRLSETLEALRSGNRPTVQKTFAREIRLASSRVK